MLAAPAGAERQAAGSRRPPETECDKMDAVHAKPAGEATLPEGHPPIRHGKIGVLLANLGSPSGTDYWSMRRYLKEFLSDRRVIEVPRWKWWPILNLIILTVRPGRKARCMPRSMRAAASQNAGEGLSPKVAMLQAIPAAMAR